MTTRQSNSYRLLCVLSLLSSITASLGCRYEGDAQAAPSPSTANANAGVRLSPYPKGVAGNLHDRRLSHLPEFCWKTPDKDASYRADYQFLLTERVIVAYLGGLTILPAEILPGLHPKSPTAIVGPIIESSDLPPNVAISNDKYSALSRVWDLGEEKLDIVELSLLGEVSNDKEPVGILVKYSARPIFKDKTTQGRGTRATLCIPFHKGDEMTIYLEDLHQS